MTVAAFCTVDSLALSQFRDRDQPIFYTLFLMDPPTPYTPPAQYQDQFFPA